MTDFASDLARFAAEVLRRERAVFVNTVSAVKQSITDGSAVTGAPGQPVDTGTLKASWHLAFESPRVAVISTNISYAPVIEDNSRASFDPKGTNGRFGVTGGQIGPALPGGSTKRHKSTVGGHHSVKQTIAGFSRLVEAEVAQWRS